MTVMAIQMTITTATTTATMICIFLNFTSRWSFNILIFFLVQLTNQTSNKQNCKQKKSKIKCKCDKNFNKLIPVFRLIRSYCFIWHRYCCWAYCLFFVNNVIATRIYNLFNIIIKYKIVLWVLQYYFKVSHIV